MPELPEVERAVIALRLAAVGRRIDDVQAHHAVHRKQLPPPARRSLRGTVVTEVRRRGKHQMILLDDGRMIHAHFRMSGDWVVDRAVDPLPPYARLSIVFTDGSRVVLADPRALSSIRLANDDRVSAAAFGPEPWDEELTPASLRQALARRRVSIKVALLDQRVIAGIGNIYAAESLWEARIDPRVPANRIGRERLERLIHAVRSVLRRALELPDDFDQAFMVYDREGEPCHRCRSPIRRIVQGGRSTYFCPRCQRR